MRLSALVAVCCISIMPAAAQSSAPDFAGIKERCGRVSELRIHYNACVAAVEYAAAAYVIVSQTRPAPPEMKQRDYETYQRALREIQTVYPAAWSSDLIFVPQHK